MNKDSRSKPAMPDKDLMAGWKRNPVTQQVYLNLCSYLAPAQAWRNCPLDKLEYYRGQQDIMDELAKVFEIKSE